MLHHDFHRFLDALGKLNPAQIEDAQTKILNLRRKSEANSLHARYGKFIEPFCGPATKDLDGYIRWPEVRLAGMRPAAIVRAS